MGVPDAIKGEAVWAFVVVKVPMFEASRLMEELRGVVAEALGKSFAPSRVVFLDELPKTRSGKVVRRAIRASALGEPAGDLTGLEDPRALEAIRKAMGIGRMHST